MHPNHIMPFTPTVQAIAPTATNGSVGAVCGPLDNNFVTDSSRILRNEIIIIIDIICRRLEISSS